MNMFCQRWNEEGGFTEIKVRKESTLTQYYMLVYRSTSTPPQFRGNIAGMQLKIILMMD